ncbi:MAG: VOC family protein [Candidatus Acidiferrales bacterium]
MRLPILILPMVGLLLLASPATAQGEKTVKTIEVKKITAVLLVQEIEPCLNLWVDRLGFTKTTEVPDGDKLAFVILQKGATEVMYQTFASVEKDDAQLAKDARKGPTFLYVEVDDLDAVIAALKGVPVVMPVRTTFYGAKEIGVKDPAGHFVTFAQYGAAAH